jgi:hypothetical protein
VIDRQTINDVGIDADDADDLDVAITYPIKP